LMYSQINQRLYRMAKYRKRTISLVLLPVFTLCAIGYLILEIVKAQDAQLNDERTRFLRAVVKNQASELSLISREYTLWNEAVDLIIKKKDREWADDNIGAYLFDTYDLNASIVLSPENKEFMRFEVNPKLEKAMPSFVLENEEILNLVNDTRAHSPKNFKAYADWVKIENELYLVSASTFTYQYNYEKKATSRTDVEKYVLLLFKRVDQKFWNDLSQQYSLPYLTFNDILKKGVKVSIADRHQHIISHLIMEGQANVIGSIFTRYGTVVALMMFLLIAIAVYTFKRSIDFKHAHDEVVMLNETMDSLVRERTAELEKALLEAEAASKAKSTFLSSMSHEFRTPLNGILGFAQLLQLNNKSALSPKEKDWLQHIRKAGDLLLALVSDVLDMAHVESGKITLENTAIQPREIFQQCYDISTPAALERNVTLEGHPETDKYVYVDRRRLQQVILNLVNNAIKYNKEGGSVVFGCQTHGPDTVRLYVKDSGQGISVEDQKLIFEPFYRSNKVSNFVEGTGVGLALVVRLTEAMGGKVHLESTLGEGSTFYLDFPAHEAPENEYEI